MNQIASIGHNLPPSDVELLLSRLGADNEDITKRHADLVSALDRLPDSCPDTITAEKLAAFGVQLKSCADELEAKRVLDKKPYDNLANTVHNFFKGRIDSLNGGMTRTKVLIKGFNDKEAARLKREAEEKRLADEAEAARLRDEADKLANQAAELEQAGKKTSSGIVLERAQEIEAQANKAQESIAAPVKVAAPSMIRSSTGGSASSTGRWVADITDIDAIDLNQLREYLKKDAIQMALNSWMRIKVGQLGKDDPAPIIKGALIHRETGVQFRS